MNLAVIHACLLDLYCMCMAILLSSEFSSAPFRVTRTAHFLPEKTQENEFLPISTFSRCGHVASHKARRLPAATRHAHNGYIEGLPLGSVGSPVLIDSPDVNHRKLLTLAIM